MSGFQKPLRYNPSTGGFTNFQGDDNFYLDYTSGSGALFTLRKSGTDAVVVENAGATSILPVSGNTSPSLQVGWNTGYSSIDFYDQNLGSTYGVLTQGEAGSGKQFQLESEVSNHADSVGLKVLFKTESATPLGNIFTLHVTDALSAEVDAFSFASSGSLTLERSTGANILWNTEGAGSIGAAGANRPGHVYAELDVWGGDSYLADNYLYLGPQDTSNKHIVARITGTNDPTIRWNQSGTQWELSPDGSSYTVVSSVNSWDALYALDTSLSIDGSSLDFQGAHASNVTFRLGATGTGNVVEVWGGTIGSGTNLWAVSPAGAVSHNAVNPADPFDTYTITLTAGALAATETVRGVVVSLAEGTTATGGNLYGADFQYTTDTGTIDESRAINVDGDWTYGLYTQSPVEINIGSPTALTISKSSGGDLIDATNGSSSVFVVNRNGETLIQASNSTYGLRVRQNTTGDILQLREDASDRWIINKEAAVVHTATTGALPAAGDAIYTMTGTSGGVAGASGTAGVSGVEVSMTGSTGDTSNAIIAGFKASYTDDGGAGSNVGIGFWADTSHTFGLYSQSQCNITVGAGFNRALEVTKNSAAGSELEAADVSLVTSDADHTGTVFKVLRVKGTGASDTTSGGTVHGVNLEYDETGTQVATTHAVHVSDANEGWTYGLYSHARAYIRQASTTGAVPVLELDQDDIDQAFIDFQGQESANQTDSISNVTGGGAATGPGSTAWDIALMVQVEINGTTYYMPAYSVM